MCNACVMKNAAVFVCVCVCDLRNVYDIKNAAVFVCVCGEGCVQCV